MSRRNDAIDSDIEQQLASDDALFARMSAGVEDDEVPVQEEPVEEPKAEEVVPQADEPVVVDEPEIDEGDPMNEQVYSDEDDEDVEEEVDTPPTPNVEKLYTPEEIKELLTEGDFSRIDTSRLSEEGKLVMKSMQSGLTPKLQEAAELRRQMEELSETVKNALPKPQPKDIFEAFDQDPKGVMTFVNNQIQERIAAGDTVGVEQLRETRDQLRDYRDSQPPAVEPVVAQSTAAVELLAAIPDIKEKQHVLRDYALQVMGYTEAELVELTDLQRGEAAVRETIRINNAYERSQAPKRAAKKAVKKKPAKVEKTGGGFEQPETTNKDRIAQAKKSGSKQDWLDVFYHMED